MKRFMGLSRILDPPFPDIYLTPPPPLPLLIFLPGLVAFNLKPTFFGFCPSDASVGCLENLSLFIHSVYAPCVHSRTSEGHHRRVSSSYPSVDPVPFFVDFSTERSQNNRWCKSRWCLGWCDAIIIVYVFVCVWWVVLVWSLLYCMNICHLCMCV